jgi:hypothetical protein
MFFSSVKMTQFICPVCAAIDQNGACEYARARVEFICSGSCGLMDKASASGAEDFQVRILAGSEYLFLLLRHAFDMS